MNPYLALQKKRLEQDRGRLLSDAHANATRVMDAAQRIAREIESGDERALELARTRFAELAQLLPQYLAPIDDHLTEAEIVARFAANLANSPKKEASR